MPLIILASASPRRRDLLRAAGLDFRIQVAGVDEHLGGNWSPVEAASGLALRKAQAVAADSPPGHFVIGADTIVAIDGSAGRGEAGGSAGESPRWQLLGKPEDGAQARKMLRSLSATRHQVVTGVAVVPTDGGSPLCEAEITWVTMRVIRPAEIEAYVESGEWKDKAGGYAIQENADAFVTRLEGGGFDNVVGLPVARTLDLLARAGACGLPSPDL